jgi:hypothetical protein
VLLVRDDELSWHGIEDIVERGLRQGLTVIRRPVKRASTVPIWLMNDTAHWAGTIDRTVYSASGVSGRAAAATAWALILRGMSAAEAVTEVRGKLGSKALDDAVLSRSVTDFAAHPHGTDGNPFWHLPSEKLRRSHLPPPRAPWHPAVNIFALSFDGYAFRDADALDALTDQALRAFDRSGELPATLTLDDLRAVLFAIQRRWRWRSQEADLENDPGPYADELRLIWRLIEAMRERVTRA